jgi:hypothetical protein
VAPGSSESIVSAWRCVPLADVVAQLRTTDPGRTGIIAIDGRSAGGKTTLAETLHTAMPNSAVVHTDDVAWNYSMFDWADALADNVIAPVRSGEPVHYRPPGWAANGRLGTLDLPGRLDTLIVEGVGAGRRALAGVIDILIWVQSDFVAAQERGLARDIASGVNGGPDETRKFWDWWMAAELPFLEREEPWWRADLTVAGSGAKTCPGRDQIAIHP